MCAYFFKGQAGSWLLKMGLIACPETSVNNYQHVLRNTPTFFIRALPDIYNLYSYLMVRGDTLCATSRKVAGSIPIGVTGIFH